ncbi:MAG TPA: DUF2845 domain-containing protein [Steroidobacteraceae bacterium]|nr:DUF2845 domain-containing protein [Steroidobacteraceae bacterium]
MTARFALATLLLLTAFPAAAFHCGVKLVHEGDSRYDVRAKCGEPADIETRAILRQPIVWHHGRPVLAAPGSLVEVTVELWTYNFGPHKLMRRLRFEDGELVEIETLGYGYIKT